MNLEKLMNYTHFSVGNLKAPKVIFDDENIKGWIAKWCVNRIKISEKFGKILAGLGFNSSDEITLKNLHVDRNQVTFNYAVNGEDSLNNVITLSFANYIYQNTMTISNDREEVSFRAYVINNKNICLLKKQYSEQLKNGVLYKRTFESDFAKIEVIYDNIMKLELKLHRKENFDFDHLLVRDEEGLKRYLESLTILPGDTTEIYKNICTYLGDIKSYLQFSLAISFDDGYNKGNKNIKDMISLSNGEFVEYKTMMNGRMITLNKNGSWTYEEDTSVVTLKVENGQHNYTYDFVYKNGNNVTSSEDISLSNIKTSVEEKIEKVKKRTRKMFDDKKNGSN